MTLRNLHCTFWEESFRSDQFRTSWSCVQSQCSFQQWGLSSTPGKQLRSIARAYNVFRIFSTILTNNSKSRFSSSVGCSSLFLLFSICLFVSYSMALGENIVSPGGKISSTAHENLYRDLYTYIIYNFR